ncbi:MAG: hypothetical protein PHN52_08755 [candidate division Zixibacteria bacterium]|nr:hypothetical protein [candidate division Zixibacteria bacterium]
MLLIFPRWTVDDAYITYRYAENFAWHGQLTWNLDEDPVEGYTGIALPVILAFFIKMGFEPSLISHLIGITGLFGTGMLLYFLMGRLAVTGLARALIIFIFFSSPFLYKNAFSGLESLLFSLFISASLYNFDISLKVEKNYRSDLSLMILLVLTGLTRPEGVVLAGLIICALGYIRYRESFHKLWPFVVKAGIFYFIPALIYFLWRWHYYGQFLPNTYYAKLHNGLIALRTLKDLIIFFLDCLFLPTLGVILLFGAGYRRNLISVKEYIKNMIAGKSAMVYAVAVSFTLISFLKYLKTELMMNFSHRFFVPFYPVFLILFGSLLMVGIKNWQQSPKLSQKRILRPLIVILCIVFLINNYFQLKNEINTTVAYRQLLAEVHIPAGIYLKETIPPDEWLSVYIDAGAIPYYAGLKTIDFGKLNDEALATGNFSQRELADYFFSKKPAAAVFTSSAWDSLDNSRRAHDITKDGRFASYRLVKKYRCKAVKNYFEFIYLRNDLIDENMK